MFAIATGTTLSSGLFLLPGLAAKQAGPAVVVAYLIAAIPLIPAALSVVELATATPRAGGAYYFLDRSMGPMVGTIGGIGTWLALILKTAFALVGMGAYVSLFIDNVPMTWVAAGFAVIFGVMNLVGAKATGRLQIVLVSLVLAALVWFETAGLLEIDTRRFEGFWDAGFHSVLATAAMVYVSYVGVTKVASVSEEVKNPERNLPLGVFLSVGATLLIYICGITVMVGVIPAEALHGDLTPVATAARLLGGKIGVAVVSVAAIFAFSSVANAGILSASRYPLAMSRDHLMPRTLARLSKEGIPRISVLLTVGIVLSCILILDPTRIAKLASAFQLLMFALICAAVIVMRESGIESYDPGYRSPLYPYTQIVGILSAFFLLAQMGWLPQIFTFSLIGFALVWYFRYGKPRVARPGAVLHVFERLGRDRTTELDVELRGIMKEKGIRRGDQFDELVAAAEVIDADQGSTFEDVTRRAANTLAPYLPEDAEWACNEFLEGTRVGATPVAKGIALPHCRHKALDEPHLVIVRSVEGIRIEPGDAAWGEHSPEQSIHALFYLASPENEPGRHLRFLAKIAAHAEDSEFMGRWLSAGGQDVRDLLKSRDEDSQAALEAEEAARHEPREPVKLDE